MTVAAIDYDGTLVDGRTQEWLPGALLAVKELLASGVKVIVHSSRANWPQGRLQIEAALQKQRLWPHPAVSIEPKPHADVYVDNLAAPFKGDWSATRMDLRQRGIYGTKR